MSAENSKNKGRDGTNQTTREISNLVRREIQAPVMACLLAGFIREIGYDKAMDAASAAIQMDAENAGKTMAGKYGGNTIKELLRVIREGWAEENALVYEILEETEQILSFNVTRCRYAEMYDRLGVKEFGFCFSCNRDEPLIKGFNPRMKLTRTQTIMEGSKICDFRIVVE
jgi:hypothetical protein